MYHRCRKQRGMEALPPPPPPPPSNSRAKLSYNMKKEEENVLFNDAVKYIGI